MNSIYDARDTRQTMAPRHGLGSESGERGEEDGDGQRRR
jgi:hypothetical protein